MVMSFVFGMCDLGLVNGQQQPTNMEEWGEEAQRKQEEKRQDSVQTRGPKYDLEDGIPTRDYDKDKTKKQVEERQKRAKSPSLGLVNGQSHKSTSLGLECQSAKDCDGAGCYDGKVGRVITTNKTEKRAKYKTVSVRCPECVGIDKNFLWIKPCSRCGISQFIHNYVLDGYEYVPVTNKHTVKENCQKCQGVGRLSFGPRFRVADADFSKKMNWKDAMDSCSSLGDGWRLPTKEELTGMYEFLHMKGKGNFKDRYYWSSSQYTLDYAWHMSFYGGTVYNDYDDSYKNFNALVRAVRDLP